MNRLAGAALDFAIKIFSPLFMWIYNPAWHRKHILKFIFIAVSTPVFGYLRGPYVRKQFGKQIQNEIEEK
jgi:hypothetical protein